MVSEVCKAVQVTWTKESGLCDTTKGLMLSGVYAKQFLSCQVTWSPECKILQTLSGVDPGFSEGGGANDGKGEWGVPPPTQSRDH